MRSHASLLAVASVALAACNGHRFHDGVFAKERVRYRVGALERGWRAVAVEENDLAFLSQDSAHSVAVNSTCEGHGDAPLPVLMQHLLIGFSQREKLTEALARMDGRESLRSRYRAMLDGVPVELDLVVLKKDGCVYDFMYLSAAGRFDEKRAVFERLLADFRTEAPQ
jgi:hypothetical protein